MRDMDAHILCNALQQFLNLDVDIHLPCIRRPSAKCSDSGILIYHDFSAINPPARNECTPIMQGSIILSCILRVFVVVLTNMTMSPLVTSVHNSLQETSQSRLSSVTLLLRMWYTLNARAAMAPFLTIDSWCKVCPILPFF